MAGGAIGILEPWLSAWYPLAPVANCLLSCGSLRGGNTAERYRSGRNGIDSKSIWGPKAPTGVRIPLSPPFICSLKGAAAAPLFRPRPRGYDRAACGRTYRSGEMPERPKGHDWKSCVRSKKCTGGSNPPLSARLKAGRREAPFVPPLCFQDGWPANGATKRFARLWENGAQAAGRLFAAGLHGDRCPFPNKHDKLPLQRRQIFLSRSVMRIDKAFNKVLPWRLQPYPRATNSASVMPRKWAISWTTVISISSSSSARLSHASSRGS